MFRRAITDPRCLIISRTDRIGDAILTFPLARVLKKRFPACRLLYLGAAYTQPIIASCADYDAHIDWSAMKALELSAQIKAMQALGADTIIHVLADKAIARLARKARITNRVGTSRRWFHQLYCSHLVNYSRRGSSLHEAQLNLKLLRAFALPDEYALADLQPLMQLTSSVPPLTVTAKIPSDRFTLILHPGSMGTAREWPMAYFEALATQVMADKVTVLLTGSAAEAERFQPLISALPQAQNLMGQLSLAQLLQVIQLSDGIIASSTGPLHMGAASGIHALGLYSSVKKISPNRWGPIGAKAEVLVTPNSCTDCLTAAPCHCMDALTVKQVLARVTQWRLAAA